MDREQAKEYIREHAAEYLRRDKNGRGYICPICGDGGDKGRNGITTRDNIHFTCWRGCFSNADIFEIIGLEYNTKDFTEQIKIGCNALHIDIDGNQEPPRYKKQDTQKQQPKEEPKEEHIESFKDFYLEAHKHIKETEYAHKRGLSDDIINRFKLGYIENWKHPKAPSNSPSTPRLIIPISEYSYLARDTRTDIPQEQQDFKKSKCKGKDNVSWIFNAAAIKNTAEPIFILEGEIDALSIIEVGGQATAIGSTAYTRAFIEYIKKNRPTQPLILAFDNDKAGRECKDKIGEALKEMGIAYKEANIAGQYKDANEALINDREGLQQAIEQAKAAELEELKEASTLLLKETALESIKAFRERISTGEKPIIIPTGFNKLDEVLNGGLRTGFYTIGAISSLGKTSFCIQLADNIAKQNKPVLYVSLEMARDELIAKCLSRLTYEKAMAKYKSFNTAKTTVGILNTHEYKGYERESQAIISEAMADLETRAENLIILEGIGNIGVEDIKAKAQEIKKLKGAAPVVFVDYLQIIGTDPHFKGTDKQAIDKAVLELKRLSRDEDTPVICISSFSRDNYKEPVSLTSFKESGAIEYTCDVALGLQYYGLDYEAQEISEGSNTKGGASRRDRIQGLINEAQENGKRGKAQALEIKVLKNRNGNKGKVNIDFVPMFNYFKEAVRTEEDEYKPLPKNIETI